MPKISIITPVWCDVSPKVDWLGEMIESVKSQTLADWEIILIDDQSPLSLDSVKMKYGNDERLRWFENAANSGPAITRNAAVALATAECILPLDADDLLASSEILEYMYDAWIMDQTKIIYGNLQMYMQTANNIFQRGKVIHLGEYTFELAMNLGGVMPVTAMHSKDCHYAAGGWKSQLDLGLEDVEYWIAAGERGYCGRKMNETTLIYRRQENSRAYKLKFINQQFEAMQQKIKAMHPEIYRGVFPMACCGGKGKASAAPVNDPVVMSQQAQGATRITTLDGYDEKDLEWVAYQGGKKARFDIIARGPAGLPSAYTILGTGHHFQIHKAHRKLFADRQRLGFQMNRSDPRERQQPEVIAAPSTPEVVELPKPAEPEMSVIIRPDRIAIESGVVIQPTENEMAIEASLDWQVITPDSEYHLADIGLSTRLTSILSNDERNWTVEKLAETTPKSLIHLPSVGTKTAEKIIIAAQKLIEPIDKAQELIKQG